MVHEVIAEVDKGKGLILLKSIFMIVILMNLWKKELKVMKRDDFKSIT